LRNKDKSISLAKWAFKFLEEIKELQKNMGNKCNGKISGKILTLEL
jgi:hypothetical protein